MPSGVLLQPGLNTHEGETTGLFFFSFFFWSAGLLCWGGKIRLLKTTGELRAEAIGSGISPLWGFRPRLLCKSTLNYHSTKHTKSLYAGIPLPSAPNQVVVKHDKYMRFLYVLDK